MDRKRTDNAKKGAAELAVTLQQNYQIALDLSAQGGLTPRLIVEPHDTPEDVERGREQLIKTAAELNQSGLLATQTKPEPSGITLSEALAQYVDDKTQRGEWREKTALNKVKPVEYTIEILGDIPLAAVKRHADGAPDLNLVKSVLYKIPANKNGLRSPYKDVPVLECIKLPDVKPRRTSTADDDLNALVSFFNWCERQGLIDKNPARGLFEKSRGRGTVNPIEERSPFEPHELKAIFESDAYRDQSGHWSEHSYWVPIIALYTGMRLNEICQLWADDIRDEGGIAVFSINDNGTEEHPKRLKFDDQIAAKRFVPIHPKLIELGLLELAQRTKHDGRVRLFQKLKWSEKNGYVNSFQNWFNGIYLPKVVTDKQGKSFHSFRHNFIDYFRQNGIGTDSQISRLAGHKQAGMTNARYGKAHKPESLKPLIDQIDYGIEHPPFNWQIYRGRLISTS